MAAVLLEPDWDASVVDVSDNACVQEQSRVVGRFVEMRVAARDGTDTRAMLVQVRADWHRWFLPLSQESRRGAFQVAYTDLGLLAMSHVWARDGDNETLGFSDIWHTWVGLVVVSSQHTAEARAMWPSAVDWAALRTRVAQVVARYFDGAPPSRAALIRQLSQGTAEEEHKVDGIQRSGRAGAAHVMDPLSAPLAAAHEARRMPPSLAMSKRKAREKAAAEVAAGTMRQADVREEASIEAQGAMWRATTDDLVHEYVRVAGRVIWKVDTDDALVAHFQRVAPRVFNQHVYDRAYAWVQTRCRTEQTDAMSKMFRDTANEWWQPLGSDTHRWRSKLTRSDLSGAQSMLRDEIGIDLGSHLHERSMVTMTKLAAAHPGAVDAEASMLWTPLFLVLLHYALLQKSTKKIDFIQTYVHAHSHDRTVRARMDKAYFRGMPRRPLLVFAQRRWWMHHEGRLHGPHDSLLHAVLEWFFVLADAGFGGRTEDGYDVACVGSCFLGNDLHTCLRQ